MASVARARAPVRTDRSGRTPGRPAARTGSPPLPFAGSGASAPRSSRPDRGRSAVDRATRAPTARRCRTARSARELLVEGPPLGGPQLLRPRPVCEPIHRAAIAQCDRDVALNHRSLELALHVEDRTLTGAQALAPRHHAEIHRRTRHRQPRGGSRRARQVSCASSREPPSCRHPDLP